MTDFTRPKVETHEKNMDNRLDKNWKPQQKKHETPIAKFLLNTNWFFFL